MWFILAGVVLVLLISGLFTVRQQTVALIERFGRFKRVALPGLNLKIPLIDRIVGRPNLRIQQLDVQIETKTKDNVFITCVVSVQYFILPDKVVDAFYKLQNPREQITSYVFDTVRARVPAIILDDVFERKDDIAHAVKQELDAVMDDFGYGILKTLVTDIDPDAKVKSSMNEINAAQRMREATIQQAEAEKIRVVKAAEGEAESKALQGKGIADQRKAIIDGLKISVESFSSSVDGANAQDVMNLVLMTQYFDTLKDIGLSGKSNTILIPHSPGGMGDISEQMRNAIITANEVTAPSGKN
jgi:regulator of protease activity HflC (stomatin/prohibitin superfamily)